jgi:hypothetical protein
MIVEPLQRVAHVGVLVDPPVLLGEVGIDRLDRLLHELSGFAQALVLLAVEDVGLGHFSVAVLDKDLLDQVLDVFHRRHPTVLVEDIEDPHHLPGNAGGLGHVAAADGAHGLLDGGGNIPLFEGNQTPVPFTNTFQHDSPSRHRKRTRANLAQQSGVSRQKNTRCGLIFFSRTLDIVH